MDEAVLKDSLTALILAATSDLPGKDELESLQAFLR